MLPLCAGSAEKARDEISVSFFGGTLPEIRRCSKHGDACALRERYRPSSSVERVKTPIAGALPHRECYWTSSRQ
jgi:hypothetical protein